MYTVEQLGSVAQPHHPCKFPEDQHQPASPTSYLLEVPSPEVSEMKLDTKEATFFDDWAT